MPLRKEFRKDEAFQQQPHLLQARLLLAVTVELGIGPSGRRPGHQGGAFPVGFVVAYQLLILEYRCYFNIDVARLNAPSARIGAARVGTGPASQLGDRDIRWVDFPEPAIRVNQGGPRKGEVIDAVNKKNHQLSIVGEMEG